jgi:tetratricopeptide (TPR) repeat protein
VAAVAIAVVIGIVYFAAKGAMKTNAPNIAGADPRLQQTADAARAILERDSTNVAARIGLANVLYDTANWDEAIIHYKSAMRLDPQRVTTVVDLGVCYYNLGRFTAAESLFTHALTIDPAHPIALFNLGIVAQQQGHWNESLDYFHRAVQANPPAEVRQVLEERIKEVMEKAGKQPPPLAN